MRMFGSERDFRGLREAGTEQRWSVPDCGYFLLDYLRGYATGRVLYPFSVPLDIRVSEDEIRYAFTRTLPRIRVRFLGAGFRWWYWRRPLSFRDR